jgi:hypothetical protein
MSETVRPSSHRWTRAVEAGGAFAVGVGSVFLVLGTPVLETHAAGPVLFLALLLAFALAYGSGLYRRPEFLAAWVGAAAALALVSALTGFFNGLTDEPYATPAFVRLLPDLYGHPLQLTYHQYGSGPLSIDDPFIYLPLMPFVQLPGLDYRVVTLGAWALTVGLLRRSPAAVVLMGSPWVAMLAANGFNDAVPLLLLTLTFVSLRGWSSRLAEVVSLGLKQFANAIIVVYYLWRRQWKEALLAVGITVAFLLPFAILDPSGVLCHAILLDPQPVCTSGNVVAFVIGVFGHLNYYVWPIWAFAVFGPAYLARLRGPDYARERAAVARWFGGRADGEAGRDASAWTLVLVPLVRFRDRLVRAKS